jgi:hypothetical protein
MLEPPPPKKKRRPDCTECKRAGILNTKFDSYFCEHCNIWLESACEDANCIFCPKRPEKPMEVACVS